MSAQVYKAMKDLLNEKGYQGIMIDCSHISEIQDRFHSMRHQDMFDHGFYEKELLGLEFDMVDRIPWLESIIIVAMPQPRYELTFWIEEKPFPAIIPPQYLASDELIVKKRLAPWMAKQGYRMAQVELPMKHLAVHSGLAYYGRNNLAYIPGMGSFLRLMAFVTDLPCHDDQWGERRLLDRCHNCTACQKCCPTKALDTDRFLLHAERCLTYHNESVDDFMANFCAKKP